MKITNKFLFFYGTAEVFSNWHPVAFSMNGVTFRNSEQAMMYYKAKLMGDTTSMVKILNTPDPYAVKKLGREIKPWDDHKWNSDKLNVMVDILVHKFSSEALKEALLSTGELELVEASPYDKIWGIGMREDDDGVENKKNWKGQNLLGIALMNARSILKGQA